MMPLRKIINILSLYLLVHSTLAFAEDIDGVEEHPLISRYPGQEIRWQHIENYMPYKIPVGPVTGYRTISDWIETEGRVTRTFYRYQGSDRTYSEIYKNYMDALVAQDFEILGSGVSVDRRGNAIGSATWTQVLFIQNPATKPGEVGTFFSGTSSSGGAGSIVARKERAAGTVYALINVEQHSSEYVGTLIDIIEVEQAETGLVIIDPEAIGADIDEYGRVILDGIFFEFDQAILKEESNQALKAIADYLNGNPNKNFYVVGHTDSVGTFSYNQKLSSDRAMAVADALKANYNIASKRIIPHGVGPLSPVFSNGTDAGREQNRRVELVEIQRQE